jgi:predicted extracellular nuclease
VTACGDGVTVETGDSAEEGVTASDVDGAVTGAEITAGAVDGISLTDVVPATADGGTLTAILAVDSTVPIGFYDVEITFTNDDTVPRTARCTVPVTVTPDLDVPTPISTVQGPGDESPLAGLPVTVEAVATSVLLGDEEGDQLGGFFLEEEAADRDDDPQSSEGIFVFAGAQSGDLGLATGDLVEVTGVVGERFGQTQINASAGTITEVAPGPDLPDPAVLTELPAPSAEARADAWEPLEGMRVQLGGTWTVTDNFVTHTFGELEILPGQQPIQWPTNVMEPGPEAGAIEDAILANFLSITLDDARDGNLVELGLPAPYFNADGTGTIRRGTTLDDQVTIMSFGFGSYRLRPINDEDNVDFDYAARPPAPPVAGDLTVSSFNVLNYFNGNGDGTGFPTERGADTFEEFERQSAKIEAALAELDADVVGLIEIENDGTEAPLDALPDLVQRLNDELVDRGSERRYDYVDTGTVGTDAIKNAFIYDPDAVTLAGFDILDDVDPFNRNTRPPIAARFVDNATGEEFVPIVNHFKSKGSGSGENADMGDGQGASNLDRIRAARALLEWTETDAFFGADERLLVIGDLNAYAEEDPIDVFTEDDAYTDLLDVFYDDTAREAYSFAFFGAEGRLDHALANPSALEVVVDAAVWHLNADEPRAKDYTFFNQPELYEPDPYRSSDHDAVVVGLVLDADQHGGVTTRLAGDDRIETAIEISQDSFDASTAEAVVLARADIYPDALAGTPLAVAVDGPLLITSPDDVRDDVGAEIQRVLPSGGTVHILGGPQALDASVRAELEALGYQVVRIGGQDRIDTAIAVAEAIGDPEALLITTGYDFPDGLAAGTAAAANAGAVLLTTPDERHPAVDEYLLGRDPGVEVYAVGGPAVRAYPAARPVWGQNRDATAVAVAEVFFTDPTVAGFARRDDFPDALSGGAHIARQGGPLLLTGTETLSSETAAYVCDQMLAAGFVYGGPLAISEDVRAAIEARIEGQGC